jgi:hypothetical protein
MSGVGCKQVNCSTISNAHYSYEGYCICGSAGSINENPKDPNKRCALPHENAGCPDCVFACVHNNESCPGEKPSTQPSPQPTAIKTPTIKPTQTKKITDEQERIIKLLNDLPSNNQNGTKVVVAGISWESVKSLFQRGFGASMTVLGWGLNKISDYQLIQDPNNKDSGWAGMLVAPNGDWVTVKIFEGKLDFDWDNKNFAGEFNLISIKSRPSNRDFIDGFSVGVGPGAVNKDEADREIPGTPISPNINIRNIEEYFSEKWIGTKSWWHENVPWPLGGANAPAIGGEQ